MTNGVSSPAILYMLGIMSSRPCEAVKVVARLRPAERRAERATAPPSLCISITWGTVPQMLLAVGGPLVAELAHGGRRGDGIDSDNFVGLVGDIGGGFVAVNGHFDPIHESVLHGITTEMHTRDAPEVPAPYGLQVLDASGPLHYAGHKMSVTYSQAMMEYPETQTGAEILVD